MSVQTLKIGNRVYVVLPKRDFDRIVAKARVQAEQELQDAGDVAESRRRLKEPDGLTLAEFKKKLGI